MVVYKYPVPVNGHVIEVFIPPCATVLCTQYQHNFTGPTEVMWVLLDEEINVVQPRKFKWFETGEISDILKNAKYTGTLQDSLGLFFHLFELIDSGSVVK